MTVVGDLHGQLADLFSIFQLNGLPSAKNQYVFNGDWVDRGVNSCECVLLIFCWKLLLPHAVHLNRGNHEAADINSRDGFQKEVESKYGVEVFELFSEIFACVPLCCVIGNLPPPPAAAANAAAANAAAVANGASAGSSSSSSSSSTAAAGGGGGGGGGGFQPQVRYTQLLPGGVFVTHGGLCEKPRVTLEMIQKEDRFHVIPPDNTIMTDLLWSDPMVRHRHRMHACICMCMHACMHA